METLETRTIAEQGPWSLVIDIAPDPDAATDDADCYDAADVAAWQADEWRYVGVIARVVFRGVTIGEDALWGVEEGQWADGRTVGPFADGHPLADVSSGAIDAAREFVTGLAAEGPDALADLAEMVNTYAGNIAPTAARFEHRCPRCEGVIVRDGAGNVSSYSASCGMAGHDPAGQAAAMAAGTFNPFARGAGWSMAPDLTGGYRLFAVMADGGELCEPCYTDPTNPVGDCREGQTATADDWAVVAFSHTGETDEPVNCDHCSAVISEGANEGHPRRLGEGTCYGVLEPHTARFTGTPSMRCPDCGSVSIADDDDDDDDAKGGE